MQPPTFNLSTQFTQQLLDTRDENEPDFRGMRIQLEGDQFLKRETMGTYTASLRHSIESPNFSKEQKLKILTILMHHSPFAPDERYALALPILESERVSVEIKHALHEKILHLFTKVVVGFRDMDLALKTKVTQIEQLEQMVHRQRDHINTCIARIESSHRTFGARNETLGELEQRTSDVVRELSREQHRLDALRRAEQQAAELQVCLRERQIYIQERELHLANRAQRLNDEKVSVLAIEAATKEKQREQQKTQTTLRAKEQQLDAREAALLPKEQQLDARDAALLPKEQQLTRREAAVREREEKMTKIGESINDFVFVNPVTSRSCSYIAAYAVAMSLPVSMPLVAVPVAIYALWEFGSLVADVGSDVLGTRKITAPPLTQVLARAYETHLSSN